MVVDPLSPIAPARTRALVLPVGRIKRSRFMSFVDRLSAEHVVRLGDVSPDLRSDRTMFSPLAYPNGMLLYDFSASIPSSSQIALSPFELFREPQLIIGIADGAEYASLADSIASDIHNDANVSVPTGHFEELESAINDLRERHKKALVHTMMIFDCPVTANHSSLPQGAIPVPPVEQSKTTTMKTIVCDLTSLFLAELTTLAKSIEALPTIVAFSASRSDVDETLNRQFKPTLVRSNSQPSVTGRSESPGTAALSGHHRTSVHGHLPSSRSNTPTLAEDSRPGSPTGVARTPSVRTFDDIASQDSSPSYGMTADSKPRPAVRDGSRASSRDRISFHGSSSINERIRNKGKGRVGIVIGSIYMQAGRWHDALRELVENTTRARAFSDHIWHAKGLENIMICLVLLAWAGIDFKIPQICYPIAEKAAVKSPQHTPSNSVVDVSQQPGQDSNRLAGLRSLTALAPDLVNMILSVHTRAANSTGESLPQLAFSECTIRLAKLLSTINLAGGALNYDALQHLVRGTPFAVHPALSVPRLTISPTRTEIASLLFRALPPPSDDLAILPIDAVMVIAHIASVLSSLGMQRKKAMVTKEFLAALIPGLVQARRVGAAEAGVHPAAGLAAINIANGTSGGSLGSGTIGTESSLNSFLALLGETYGIPRLRGAYPEEETRELDGQKDTPGQSPEPHDTSDAGKSVSDHLTNTILRRSFGSLHLKLDILRTCISFCEALPDFQGVLDSTAALLATAGPGVAPRANSTTVYVSLAKEEQLRLAGVMTRAIAAAKRLGLPNVETDYWDEFLVRNIRMTQATPGRLLVHHKSTDVLGSATSEVQQTRGPFLHNPFLKRPEPLTKDALLVAGEEREFIVSLQNLYDFEIDIEYLQLASEGVHFTSMERNLFLGTYRTQKYSVMGLAHAFGTLRITACVVKIKGCRKRTFPIFTDPWSPKLEVKLKDIGLSANGSSISSPASDTTGSSQQESTPPYPTPSPVQVTVIRPQPLLVVSKSTLPQSAVMVIEGESRKFTVTLQNVSHDTSADFVKVSFQDSLTSALRAASSTKNLPPPDLHELEWLLLHRSAIRWRRQQGGESENIGPGQLATFEVEVLGRPGLNDAVVQFDYANIGSPISDLKDGFYTRQVSLPLTVTVNAGIQLHRVDLIPFTGDFAWSNRSKSPAASDKRHDRNVSQHLRSKSLGSGKHCFKALLDRVGLAPDSEDHCLLLLDLRNSWPSPLSVSLQVRDKLQQDDIAEGEWRRAYTVHELIQPGHVARLVLLLPKVYIPNPQARIRPLNPANERQFVVSENQSSPDVERVTREAFWYREELLKLIRGSWKEEGGERHGEIDLRSIRLSPRMVEAFKVPDVSIDMVVTSDETEDDGGGVQQTGRSKFHVKPDSLLTLRTRIHNRSQTPIHALLRLQPSLAHQPYPMALDLDKRLAWSGLLQQPLPLLQPGQTLEMNLGISALCSGDFEIGPTVEEIEPANDVSKENERGRPRAGTGGLPDTLVGDSGRRMWHAREACTIVARRG